MNASSTERPQKTALGVALIVSAVCLMSVQEALFKRYSAELSLWQIFTLRSAIALPVVWLIACQQNRRTGLLRHALQRWSLVRSLCLTLMFVAMYAAIPFLSLSSIAAGIYTGPVFVTLLAAFAIDEPVGVRGWLAIALGFLGVLLILQPGTEAFSLWTLLPILGGFFYALSNIVTRGKCQHVPVTALALSLSLALFLVGAVMSLILLIWQAPPGITERYPFVLSGWFAMSMSEWQLIVVLALLVVVIAMGLAAAYQVASPSVVATFDYSYLLFVALWDYVVFSSTPGFMALVGMAFIVLAGLLALRRRLPD